MTELEMIERAKIYMDKLQNGINPLDDTITPAQTFLLEHLGSVIATMSNK